MDLTLCIIDLSGYTALAEAHGALRAAEIVLRFQALVRENLEPGVWIVNAFGDEAFCAGADTMAVVRCAIRMRDAVELETDFPRVHIGLHRGRVVAREGQLFGAAINLTARVTASAGGGEIVCTTPIAAATRSGAKIKAFRLASRRFRNVLRPVAVFELIRPADRRVIAGIDPVCRMKFNGGRPAATVVHQGTCYRFCSRECARVFATAPHLYISPSPRAALGLKRSRRATRS